MIVVLGIRSNKIKITEKVRELGVLDVLTKAQLTPTEVVNKIRQLI